jgi:hypothetical protein
VVFSFSQHARKIEQCGHHFSFRRRRRASAPITFEDAPKGALGACHREAINIQPFIQLFQSPTPLSRQQLFSSSVFKAHSARSLPECTPLRLPRHWRTA